MEESGTLLYIMLVHLILSSEGQTSKTKNFGLAKNTGIPYLLTTFKDAVKSAM